MVILDTNVIIDQLRRPPKESYLFKLSEELPKETFAISVLSVQELYAGESTLYARREELMLATIGPLKILPYTYEVAELAGKLIRDAKNSLQFADAAIAATAITNGFQLATLNKKDFAQIKGLEII